MKSAVTEVSAGAESGVPLPDARRPEKSISGLDSYRGSRERTRRVTGAHYARRNDDYSIFDFMRGETSTFNLHPPVSGIGRAFSGLGWTHSLPQTHRLRLSLGAGGGGASLDQECGRATGRAGRGERHGEAVRAALFAEAAAEQLALLECPTLVR